MRTQEITYTQQVELIKSQALNRLSRGDLARKLHLNGATLRKVLDSDTPLAVNQATYTAVTNYLVEELAKHQ